MEVSEDNMELEDGFSNGNDSKEAELSALKANIIQKGKNSYYYAHGHKADGPAWDGKEEPRLLKVDSIDSTASSSKKPTKEFDSYSWANEEKYVKIYIDFPDAHILTDDDFILTNTPDSLKFTVNYNSIEYLLFLSPLSALIESASVKKKSDKFIVTLKKKVVAAWYDLKKK